MQDTQGFKVGDTVEITDIDPSDAHYGLKEFLINQQSEIVEINPNWNSEEGFIAVKVKEIILNKIEDSASQFYAVKVKLVIVN